MSRTARRVTADLSPRGMAWIPAGTFLMGSEAFYREERPVRAAQCDAFWMDICPVTNEAFAGFVEATGYVTCAERAPDPAQYPDADPALLVPGSLVFRNPGRPVSLRDWRAWWEYVPGASWSRPEGPGSSIAGRATHPVVHVAYEDALAFAAWAGKALPTETEWEYAARGGLEAAIYPWGDEARPGGRIMANTWQGRFPWENLAEDGYEGTSPVGVYPANGFGLFDVVGNVWEWTSSSYRNDPAGAAACCAGAHDAQALTRVVKGGSHLCAPHYCLRARPASRQGQAPDSSTSHIGFRCVARVAGRSETRSGCETHA